MRLRPLRHPVLVQAASLKTGILLMVALVVASIAGTLLPYEKSLQVVYYSPWFGLLLLALAVNLVLCTFQTLVSRVLPSLKMRFSESPRGRGSGLIRRSFETSRSPEEVVAILKERGYRIGREGKCVCGKKGEVRLFAAPLTHLGLILVLVGGFLSGPLAFHGRVQLTEGESTETIQVGREPARKYALDFQIRCLDFRTETFPRTEIPSEFVTLLEVRDGDRHFTAPVEVNRSLQYHGLKFHQSSYGEVEGAVRYSVEVTDRERAATTTVALAPGQRMPVDDWAVTLGLRPTVLGLRYSLTDAGGKQVSGAVGPARSDRSIRAVRFVPAFVLGPGGRVESRGEEMTNPAILVEWIEDGQAVSSQWLFQRPDLRRFSHRDQDDLRLEFQDVETDSEGNRTFHFALYDSASDARLSAFTLRPGEQVSLAGLANLPDETGPEQRSRYTVRLLDAEPLQYTVLTVSHNPMIPLIYFGAILACAAICLAFYARRVTLWVWCGAGQETRVVVQYIPERSTPTAGVEKTLDALQ